MENKKKKTSNKTKKVPTKTTKSTVKKTFTKRKTNTKKKKSIAFTLIELLAVIIILGIIMIIAIPSVTKNITNSRKNAYIDTAKQIVGSARTLVNEGTLNLYDPNSTYYIPISCIQTENSARTPYGDFTEAYVVVTYKRDGYNYYWTSTDTSKTGIKGLVPFDKLDTKKIEAGIKDDDIKTDIGVGERENVVIFDETCSSTETKSAETMINDDGTPVPEPEYIYGKMDFYTRIGRTLTGNLDHTEPDMNYQFPYMRVAIENNVVKKIELGFVKNGKRYYLKTGLENYTKNRNILTEAFGEGVCHDAVSNGNEWYQCRTGLVVDLKSSGEIFAQNNYIVCYFSNPDSNNNSYCRYD